MRIVTYAEMLQLPPKTVFFWLPHRCEPLGPFVKHPGEGDLYYYGCSPCFHDSSYDRSRPFSHFTLNGDGTREGLFDPNNKYLALDEADVQVMIRLLQGDDEAEAPCLPADRP